MDVARAYAGLVELVGCRAPKRDCDFSRRFGWMDIVSNAARVMNVKPEECYYETPHIDQLAARGMTFTQAYSAALCSPARRFIDG